MPNRIAFILPYRVEVYSIISHWNKKLGIDSFYLKLGPIKLGDNQVEVTENETSIECMTDQAITFFRKNFPEAHEIQVEWDKT